MSVPAHEYGSPITAAPEASDFRAWFHAVVLCSVRPHVTEYWHEDPESERLLVLSGRSSGNASPRVDHSGPALHIVDSDALTRWNDEAQFRSVSGLVRIATEVRMEVQVSAA